MTPDQAREHVKAVAERFQKRGDLAPLPSLDEEMAVYVALDLLLRPPENPPLKDVQT
jgi:hypothetical protein